jgi:lactate dehydrogenase-like 2-hydroxyacid dehydrogenase
MSDKPKVLKLLKLLPWLEERLSVAYEVVSLPSDATQRADFLAKHGAEFSAVVTSAAYGIDNATMDQLPQLQVVSSFGVGLDKIDMAHAKAKGVAVGYTPDVLNDCVADLAFALLLGIGRRVSEGDCFVREGYWSSGAVGPFPLGFQVSKAKLGIVGLGRIGATIAKRSTGFEMDVRYHSRKPVASEPWTYEPSLIALAQWADFLVIITSGGAGTRHLINREVLEALGEKGFLINVARGTVVDEAALVDALQHQRIAGAALDVFEKEPFVPKELYELDNVLMVPHIASATVQTRQAMGQRVLDNLNAAFKQQPMVSAA